MTTTEERFWAKVVPVENGCWLWSAQVAADGYAQFKVDGRKGPAHRYAYRLLVGPIPEGMHLDHTCHGADESCTAGRQCQHRQCVNPAHLEPVTCQENLLRGRGLNAINAAKTECIRGHPLAGDNLRRDHRGHRRCQTCYLAAQRRSDRRRVRPSRAKPSRAGQWPFGPDPGPLPTPVPAILSG